MSSCCDPDTRLTMIQSLIPIALMAVSDALQAEVYALCGSRYARKGHLQSGPFGLKDDKNRMRRFEALVGKQPGRRHGRDPHPAPLRHDAIDQ